MVLLVNNFTEFYYKKREVIKEVTADEVFDFEGYLSMSYDCNKKFMQEFVKTQAFTNFIEAAYNELEFNSSIKQKKRTDITGFQHAIKEILRNSYDSLLKRQWVKISNCLEQFSHPLNISIADCRVQYEAALKVHGLKMPKGRILDHSKIVKMNYFQMKRGERKSPGHAKTNTIAKDMTKDRAVAKQKRVCTQMTLPKPFKNSPSQKGVHTVSVNLHNKENIKASSPQCGKNDIRKKATSIVDDELTKTMIQLKNPSYNNSTYESTNKHLTKAQTIFRQDRVLSFHRTPKEPKINSKERVIKKKANSPSFNMAMKSRNDNKDNIKRSAKNQCITSSTITKRITVSNNSSPNLKKEINTKAIHNQIINDSKRSRLQQMDPSKEFFTCQLKPMQKNKEELKRSMKNFATFAGKAMGLSSRVLSHQGDSDICLPYV